MVCSPAWYRLTRWASWRGLSLGCFPRSRPLARATFMPSRVHYRWRNQFGGLKADDAKRLKELEKENSTLKRLLADAELEKAALKELASGNF